MDNNNNSNNQGNEFSQFNNNRSGLLNMDQKSQEFPPNNSIQQNQFKDYNDLKKNIYNGSTSISSTSSSTASSSSSSSMSINNEKNLNTFYNTLNQQQLQQKQYQDAITNRKAQMFRSKSSPHVHSPMFSPMEISDNYHTTTTTTTTSSNHNNKCNSNDNLSPMLMSPVFNRLYSSHSKSTLALDGNGLVNGLPEEVLVRIFKLLNVEDLYRCYSVCTLWKRLCEDEAIFRKVCFRNYPILKRYLRPPFENSWRKYYNLRKSSFLVLGGPTSQSTCMDDICAKLRSVGIGNVDSFYAQKRLPTLEELQKYTSILIYSYNSSAFLDGQLMGDVLSDYVDNGGGVVVTVFTNCNNLRNGFLKGRFLEQNYHPIIPARQHDTNGKKPLNLGKVHVPDHPILHGVKSLEGGRSSFFCLGALNPEAKLVAEWSNGVPLIADLKKKRGRVVALNFFPPSSDTGDPRFWNSNTDGSLMMANSLVYVGKSSIFRKARLEGASYVSDPKNKESSDSRNNSSSDLRNGDPLNQSGNASKRDSKRHRFLSGKRFSFFKLFSNKKNNLNNQQQQNNP
ncbi:hypothetical protein DICPUDRAFT_157756 [Dictyostelium purpureum]|uniref:F-box domain-containing protein n=1 Tax=Dictyostelium purpureum TaxID=5786 RepID=F0ZZX2_DICPU|nr:uncharacterized protein DICPUDRAFT_157756 [Dictyostelium purpureum]EGC30518.1 hypothetical protein DICPUDRAFT_157756 [Dictyostelium purpureum]|eukprot:XP_003292966.1 hypothetical protein DICPUDRAFT_157756 [Dictyostelium purpureum]